MDLSWSFKSDNNKENVSNHHKQSNSNYISCSSSNVSFTNGVLTLSNSTYTATATLPKDGNTPNKGCGAVGANDSFDNDKIKLDVYEKSIQKLAMENKSLKKRVQKLTELARSKEEQLLEAFNEAVEDKRRQEEKYKEEHSAQLQSYYECFLQIEKENDMLKVKLEQLKEKLSEKDAKLSELNAQKTSSSSTATTSNKADGVVVEHEKEDEEREKKRRRTSQINKLSIAKMNEELNGVNKSVEMFIEDKRASTANNLKPISVSEDKHLIEANQELQRRVEELELEKEALTKKIASIESSLARWIFRACDYKDELRQMTEKAQKHLEDYNAIKAEQDTGKETNTAALNAMKQELTDKHLDELSRLKTENEMKLIETERLLKNKYEIDMCRSKTDYEIEIKTLKVKLESSDSELNRLRESNEDYLRMLSRAREELNDMKNRMVESQYVQTESEDATKEEESGHETELNQEQKEHQLNKNKSESSVMAAAASVASRFGLKSVNSASKQLGTVPVQSSSVSIAESEYNQLNRRLEQMRHEVSNLKLKIDQLTLEKKSLQCRNEELTSDLEKLSTKKSEAKIQAPTSTSTPSSLKVLATKYSQTENYVATITSSVNTQTQTAKQQSSSQLQASSDHQLIQSLRIKIEVYKNEMDQMQMNSAREINDLKRSYEERCAKAQAEIMKLESRLAQEKQTLEEIKRANDNLKTKLEEFEKMHSLSKANYEQELTKMQQESSKEKQVSDTIIMQQKKLLNFLQGKLNNGGGKDKDSKDSNQPNQDNNHHHHHHLASIFKWKSNSNPLTANLPKPSQSSNFYNVKSKQQSIENKSKATSNKSNQMANAPKAVREIEKELNSNYQAYTDMKMKSQASQLIKSQAQPSPAKKTIQTVDNTITLVTNDSTNINQSNTSKKQIHVFITGLNTCPTYCHVCQHLIPLIAYASKCQLCAFTCHSNCSSSSVQMQTADDPLKYCFNNYLTDSFGYNYIQKLAGLPQPGLNTVGLSTTELNNFNRTNFLIADNLFIYVDKRWKKIWTVLRIDGNLDLYQSSSNHKPFDTINLANDKVQFETSAQRIKKIVANNYLSNKSVPTIEEENPYEVVDQAKPKTEISPTLIILLYGPQLCLQIGFGSFSKKNIWYDALQSCNLLATSTTLTKRGPSSSNINEMQRLNTANVIKPFLELCDTIVNSYCFISDKLIALACDDGLYALNSFSSSQDPSATNIFLAKIDGIESAHKLFYHPELGKLCFIGCKSRQFFCIDVNELLTAAANSNSQPPVKKVTERAGTGLETDEEDDVNMEDYDETRAIAVRIERVDNMDRCHLFECTMINNVWYIAVATPENIYVYLFNRHLNKFSFVKLITTDTPCLSLKFTTKQTNQLIYGCKEFFALDMTYLQSTPILDSNWLKKQDDEYSSGNQSPISVCVISSSNGEQEALLLCFEDYGIFVTYSNNGWQVSKKLPTSTSSLSNTTATSTWSTSSSSSSSCLTSHLLRWPRGGGVPPLQVEYDAPLLYLFYNDSIIVYNINFSAESSSKNDLNLPIVKKLGVAFVYKPRYLGSLHTNDANCLIISNRRPLDQVNMSPASSQFSEIPKHTIDTEEDSDSDAKSSSTKIHNTMAEQELTDKICLSYFDPMAH